MSEFLLKRENINNCNISLHIRKEDTNDFCIILIYIDDINIVGTHEELDEASSCLKTEIEMKNMGKIKNSLGLQIEHLSEGIFIHQSTNLKKVFERYG